jgi:hypothetical protein
MNNLAWLPLVIVSGLFGLTSAARAQSQAATPAGYACTPGFKLIGRVCLAPDQQHAACLYPDAVGAKPKSGTLQDANPAACPRRPPR